MLVGYARVSTTDQQAGLEAQLDELRALGCEKVFSEQVSAVARRAVLDEVLRFLREGDALVVTKPDRLARSTADLLAIVDDLTRRGIGLRIISMSGLELDTSKATSKLMLTMLAAVSEFERTLMKERQRDGVRKAVAENRYKGRQPTARRKEPLVLKLRADGVKPIDIAKQTGISRASVYRILATTA